MNRILVAAHHAPSPVVSTLSVPNPVLRGATESITIETQTARGMQSMKVQLPYKLGSDVLKLRVLSMHSPAIIKMETSDAAD
jgi:hypothetical protein